MKKLCLTVISAIVLLGWAQTTQSLVASEAKPLDEVPMYSGGWRMLTPEERADPKMKAHDMSGKLPKLKTPPPSDWDWRSHNGHNWITSAKDQYGVGDCNCCWAFATVGMLEARYKIANNLPDDLNNPDLSEQVLISCETRNNGCNGGTMEYAVEFLVTTGIPDEACYPYKAKDYTNGAPCEDRCSDWESRVVKGVDYNWSYDSLDYKARVMEGPVAAGGALVKDHTMLLDHAMLLCGWNSSGEWLYKNSWGSNESYMWLPYAPRMISWVTVKSDTGTPIIRTIDSLNFVFQQNKEIYPDINSIISSGEVILNPKADEDTIKYDDGAPVPWLQGTGDWGVRFTPSQKCNVIAGLVMRKTVQVENDELAIRDDAGGVPGTPIEKVPYATQAGAPKWYRQNLSTPYQDDNDFFLTYKCRTSSAAPKCFIGGDATGGNRSFISFDGGYAWENMTPYFSSDLMIRAIVTYGGGYTASGIIWVKNVGAGKLTVTDAHSAQGSSWIVGISPKSFSVYYDDSAGIEIGVDTSGLQKDVLYTDEIVITSNSGKSETRVPVTLIIKSGGVAEEKESMLATFKLSPNPFRDKVSISYFVPEKANVKLVVRDIAGREVAKIVDRVENTGIKKIEWDTKNIPAGVYFCRLTIENSETIRRILWTRKVLLVK